MVKLLSILSLLLFFYLQSFSQSEETFSFISWKDVFGHLSSGYKIFSWAPEDRGENGFIGFSTEGLHTFNLFSQIGLFHTEVFSYSYEGTLPNTSRQKEMLTTYSSNETGLEKFTYGVKLDAIASYLFPENSFLNKYVLRTIFSIRYKYSKELYFGKANALKEFYFVPLEADFYRFQYAPSVKKIIHKEENINFKTLFIDNETSISIYSNYISEVRIFYFSSEWERPSDYFFFLAYDNKPMILGTKFDVNGIGISYETVDQGKSGLNYDLSLRFTGLSDRSIKTAQGEMQDIFNNLDSSWLNYVSLNIGAWYNIYIDEKRNKGLNFTIGIILTERRWLREYGDDNFDVIEEDNFEKLFVNIGYRF